MFLSPICNIQDKYIDCMWWEIYFLCHYIYAYNFLLYRYISIYERIYKYISEIDPIENAWCYYMSLWIKFHHQVLIIRSCPNKINNPIRLWVAESRSISKIIFSYFLFRIKMYVCIHRCSLKWDKFRVM